MHFADLGNNVWIGDFKSCNKHLKEFDLSIHIWRDENITENRVCRRFKDGIDHGIVVKYREADPIKTMSLSLRDIANYASQDGRLLIHCAGGVCRSATLCLVAKMARGRNRYKAIADIYSGMWETYHHAPELYCHIVGDIFDFFDVYISEMYLM